MLGKGFHIRIFDRHVSLARLMGANKEYIEKEIPHISSLMCASASEVVKQSDVIVVSQRDDAFVESLQSVNGNQMVVDLVRIADLGEKLNGRYYGICW